MKLLNLTIFPMIILLILFVRSAHAQYGDAGVDAGADTSATTSSTVDSSGITSTTTTDPTTSTTTTTGTTTTSSTTTTTTTATTTTATTTTWTTGTTAGGNTVWSGSNGNVWSFDPNTGQWSLYSPTAPSLSDLTLEQAQTLTQQAGLAAPIIPIIPTVTTSFSCGGCDAECGEEGTQTCATTTCTGDVCVSEESTGSCIGACIEVGWSVSLSASESNVPVDTNVLLTATANKDVGPTPFIISIFEGATRITSCGTGTTCTATVTSSTATTKTYTAKVEEAGGGNVQATSSPVSVTWTEPCTYALSMSPKGETTTLTSNTWSVTATDSSSSGCPSPITYTIPYNTSGSCSSVNVAGATTLPSGTSSFSITRGGTTSFSMLATAVSGQSCSVTIDIKAPDNTIVDPATFTVGGVALGTPSITSPTNNVLVYGTTTTLSWTPVPGAGAYQYAYESPAFTYGSTTSTSVTVSAPVAGHFWKVRACTDSTLAVCGPWSSPDWASVGEFGNTNLRGTVTANVDFAKIGDPLLVTETGTVSPKRNMIALGLLYDGSWKYCDCGDLDGLGKQYTPSVGLCDTRSGTPVTSCSHTWSFTSTLTDKANGFMRFYGAVYDYGLVGDTERAAGNIEFTGSTDPQCTTSLCAKVNLKECDTDPDCGFSPTTHAKGTCRSPSGTGGTPFDYTCRFGSCGTSNNNCEVNFCCEGVIGKDADGDSKFDSCVGRGTRADNNRYLCTAS